MAITLPNILVTGKQIFRNSVFRYDFEIFCMNSGTPGVGKSRVCAEIAKQRSLKWQDVSKIAKENGFVNEYDEKLECPILDEDKVLDFVNFSEFWVRPHIHEFIHFYKF